MDYSCKISLKTFAQLRSLRRHERSIRREKKFSCDHCSKSFKRKDDLKRHQKPHQGIITHTCNNCRKGFYRRDKLVGHQVHCQGNQLKRKCDDDDSRPAPKKVRGENQVGDGRPENHVQEENDRQSLQLDKSVWRFLDGKSSWNLAKTRGKICLTSYVAKQSPSSVTFRMSW